MSALYTEVEERSIQYGAGITRVDNAENLFKCQKNLTNNTMFLSHYECRNYCVLIRVFWRAVMSSAQSGSFEAQTFIIESLELNVFNEPLWYKIQINLFLISQDPISQIHRNASKTSRWDHPSVKGSNFSAASI